ncbi:DNA-3-methyladenine glycosylase isoform X3 [Amaranthus tricolor]|uniref:DNA-3-methyladenine glycosylase isoform X3 n=1 Tax=Amaranthus tricolor TaxID=29722 RepID=UPI002588477E|nr:DNA-3-methyladenine glycosylase isoform X3 [Amaranthus tricolor]
MLLPTTIQLLFFPYQFRRNNVPMTRPQRSKHRTKSTAINVNDSPEENPSQSKLKFRSSKSKFKLKSPLLPERPFSNVSGLDYQNLTLLEPDFCSIDALDLAPLLLGKFLRRDDVILQITEVEAYRPNDSACHGRFGITARTAPVFGRGGHAYVYLCYGLHMMLNIVADKEGVGAAVLIRSCAPVSGLTTIQQRRGQITDKPVLLAGPGKVGQALGLSTDWSNHPLHVPGGLELLDGPKPEKILVGPRVGIDYALPEHVNALWRFAIAGSQWISAPKSTLRLPGQDATFHRNVREMWNCTSFLSKRSVN